MAACVGKGANPAKGVSVKKILFVDDEPNILEGLSRMLFPMRRAWRMAFAQSGEEALKFLASEPFDVIVTDMRMPGMDGASLLQRVMEDYPRTIRFVLSGQSDRETILRSVGPAHQFLAKPCNADVLKSSIDRAFALRDLLGNTAIQNFVAHIDSIPAMPESYRRLRLELQSEEASIGSVAKIVESDLGMTAKILQLVNSAFFGIRQHVSSVTQAVSLLGLDTIKSLVLLIGVFTPAMSQKFPPGLSLEQIWRHGMLVGAGAQVIAREETNDKVVTNDAFTAGLLHDAGKLVLAENCGDEYARVWTHAAENQVQVDEVELETFGCTHAQVGAYMLGIWGLPDAVVEAVAFHHKPGECLFHGFGALAAVHVANVVDYERSGAGQNALAPMYDVDFLTRAGLSHKVTVWRELCLKLEMETK